MKIMYLGNIKIERWVADRIINDSSILRNLKENDGGKNIYNDFINILKEKDASYNEVNILTKMYSCEIFYDKLLTISNDEFLDLINIMAFLDCDKLTTSLIVLKSIWDHLIYAFQSKIKDPNVLKQFNEIKKFHEREEWAEIFSHGILELVEWLFITKIRKLRININPNGSYCLILACKYGYIDIISFLIEKCVNIHTQKDLCFIEACINGHYEVLLKIFDERTKVNAHNGKAIIGAVNINSVEIVKFLIENKANVSILENRAIKLACVKGNLEIVKLLVENGADFHTNDETPLMNSIQMGHMDVFLYLLEKGANFRILGNKPLETAICSGRVNMAKILIERGSSTKSTKPRYFYFEALINKCNDLDFVKFLIDENVNSYYANYFLVDAVKHNKIEIVEHLLDRSRNSIINIDIHYKNSALLEAIRNERIDMIKLLLKNDADIISCKDLIFIKMQSHNEYLKEFLLTRLVIKLYPSIFDQLEK